MALTFLLLCQTLQAGSYARMNTGARVKIESYEAAGSSLRLFLPGGGIVEVASGDVTGFEKDEYTPPPSRVRVPTVVPAHTSHKWSKLSPELRSVVEASGKRHGLDPDLIQSVIRAESGGNPRARSRKGAMGLMQLMPETARDMGVANAWDPAQNIDGGVRYLRYLLGLYDNNVPLALAAYNAGPARVAAYRGVPPFRETRSYIQRIMGYFQSQKR